MRKRIPWVELLIFTLLLTACNGGSAIQGTGKLQVLATTSIVGDVARQVGGELIEVKVLLPLGSDPHTFEPRPQDAAALAETQIIFANGAGLEEFLQNLIESTSGAGKLVEVSSGITLLAFSGEDDHAGGDPHTWMDPNNLLVWVDNILAALTNEDPQHADTYRSNAEAYKAELNALDAWIRSEVALVAPDRRILVSDHAVFGYFADEYGFTQLGTITASFSTNAAPSAREIAALEDSIRASGVTTILVSEGVNQDLATQVAADTGVKLVRVYHASLTDGEGPVPTYLEFMRYNVAAIVDALK